MAVEQIKDNDFDVRGFNSNITKGIGYLFSVTCFCETDLNTKLTLNTPGRTYTKLRDFKFNFQFLFTLSSKRKEIDEKVKRNVRVWLEMDMPRNLITGDVDTDYIRAGMKLFSMYGDELQKVGLISYRK